MKMFKWIPNMGNKLVDWLYEYTLGISSPTDMAKIPPDKLQEIRLRIHGVNPVTKRMFPKAGQAGGTSSEAKDSGDENNAPQGVA